MFGYTDRLMFIYLFIFHMDLMHEHVVHSYNTFACTCTYMYVHAMFKKTFETNLIMKSFGLFS